MQNPENNSKSMTLEQKMRFFELFKKNKRCLDFTDDEIIEYCNLLLLYNGIHLGEDNPKFVVVDEIINSQTESGKAAACYYSVFNRIEIARKDFINNSVVDNLKMIFHEYTHASNDILSFEAKGNRLPEWQAKFVQDYALSYYLETNEISDIMDVINIYSNGTYFKVNNDNSIEHENLIQKEKLLKKIHDGHYYLRNLEKIARSNAIREVNKTIHMLLSDPDLDNETKYWIYNVQFKKLINIAKEEISVLNNEDYFEYELFVENVKNIFDKIDKNNLPCKKETYKNMFNVVLYNSSPDELKKRYESILQTVFSNKFSQLDNELYNDFVMFISTLPSNELKETLETMQNYYRAQKADVLLRNLKEPISLENFLYNHKYMNNCDLTYDQYCIMHDYNLKYYGYIKGIIEKYYDSNVFTERELSELYHICEFCDKRFGGLWNTRPQALSIIEQKLNEEVKSCGEENKQEIIACKLNIVYNWEKASFGDDYAKQKLQARQDKIQSLTALLNSDFDNVKMSIDEISELSTINAKVPFILEFSYSDNYEILENAKKYIALKSLNQSTSEK